MSSFEFKSIYIYIYIYIYTFEFSIYNWGNRCVQDGGEHSNYAQELYFRYFQALCQVRNYNIDPSDKFHIRKFVWCVHL